MNPRQPQASPAAPREGAAAAPAAPVAPAATAGAGAGAPAPPTEVLDRLTHEASLICDRDGRILWADRSAGRLLGLSAGDSLVRRAAPGSSEKVARLLALAAKAEVRDWELQLLAPGGAVGPAATRTVSFCATPLGGGDGTGGTDRGDGTGDGDGSAPPLRIAMTGSLVSDPYAALAGRLAGALAEAATLHRESERARSEITHQRVEIAGQKATIEAGRVEAERLNRELDDTGRGLVALHAELEEKDDSLRRAGELKGRMVANIGHEFQTPLNSILGLCRLLLARADGPLTVEQEKQVGFVLQSATELSEMVRDLLDLSRLEAGKTRLRTGDFRVADLMAAQRGLLRVLPVSPDVELVFEPPPHDLMMDTDEGKIGQVLRNLVSNALKFTERGEIRVSSARLPAPDAASALRRFLAESPSPAAAASRSGRPPQRESAGNGNENGGSNSGHGGDGRPLQEYVVFCVADTGIGIAASDHQRVFDEFSQIDHPIQRKVKGTGLGLSLSRKLAETLGGALGLASVPGVGSTFALAVTRVHAEVREIAGLMERSRRADPRKAPVLVVEDDRQTLLLYEKYLEGTGFRVLPARGIEEARRLLKTGRPAAVVLDIMLEGESSWGFLTELKTDPDLRDIPVLVVTVVNHEQKARALGADEFFVKPMEQQWLLRKLAGLARKGPVEKVLIIDDDEIARYLVRRMLRGTPFSVLEAEGGREGVRKARQERPHLIILDFVMPDMTAFEVLDELKSDPDTRHIPVIINTSKTLAPEERDRLSGAATAILNKQSLSREVAITRIRDALENAGLGPPKEGHRDEV